MPHINTILDLYGFDFSQQQGLLEALRIINCEIPINESLPTTDALNAFNRQNIEVKVVAEGANPDKVNISTIFDSLARTIYAGKEIVIEKLKAIETSPTKSYTERLAESRKSPSLNLDL